MAIKKCTICGCNRKHSARGFCAVHYQRWRLHGDPLFTKIERHGHKKNQKASPTYNTWRGIIGRCENPNQASYAAYGAQGIRMCERWRNSFEAFLEDMGERPPGTSIDRIDIHGDYDPGNCRWATGNQQARNRSIVKSYTFRGESRCIPEWAERTGIPVTAIKNRLERGWSIEKTLSCPINDPETITYMGHTKRIGQWARELGVPRSTLRNRIVRGWDIERAFSEPVKVKRRGPQKSTGTGKMYQTGEK